MQRESRPNPQLSKYRTRATIARENVGLDIKGASRKLGISAGHLRRIELHGGAPFHVARQISRLYDCPMHYLIAPGT